MYVLRFDMTASTTIEYIRPKANWPAISVFSRTFLYVAIRRRAPSYVPDKSVAPATKKGRPKSWPAVK